MKTVYVDVVFVVNFLIDYLIMVLVLDFLNIRKDYWRVAFASFVGGAYSVAAAIIGIKMYAKFASLFLVIVAMLYIVLNKRSIKTYIKTYLLYYAVSFLFCGAVNVCTSFTGRKSVGCVVFLVCITLMYIVISQSNRFLKTDLTSHKITAVVEQSGQKVGVLLFCDSGNLLTDPYTGMSVILLDKKIQKNFEFIFPRFVPVKTVSGSILIEVFTPDAVFVGESNIRVDAAVGFVDSCFLSDEFDGIISDKLIN